MAQDYEGDQFTFFKYQHDDLEQLYGVVVSELMMYPSWEDRIAEQIRIGRAVLIEVDGYYLPDTRTTCYRTQHTKTTIGSTASISRAATLRISTTPAVTRFPTRTMKACSTSWLGSDRRTK